MSVNSEVVSFLMLVVSLTTPSLRMLANAHQQGPILLLQQSRVSRPICVSRLCGVVRCDSDESRGWGV